MTQRNTARTTTAQRGLSIVECLITLLVMAVALGAGVPSFEQARERRHLDGVSAQLETDLGWARSQAAAANRNLRVRFQADAAGSCYTVHTGSAQACSCSGGNDTPAVCTGAATALKSVSFAASGPVRLQSNVGSIMFDPSLGTSTPTGTLRVLGKDGRAVHHVVNIMGRVRTCSPAGKVPGHPVC